MRPLSASEAIAPAIRRTKEVLFATFKLGRSWKLAIIANLSALGAFFIPTPFFSFLAKASQSRLCSALKGVSAGVAISYSAP